jgi:hypothetical protein
MTESVVISGDDRESRGHGSPITSGMTADVGDDKHSSFPAATGNPYVL